MIELPEAANIAKQLSETVCGKQVAGVTVGHTPHKLAWYYGDRNMFADIVVGGETGRATAYGGLVEVEAGDARILFGEGVGIRFHSVGEPRPARHQLLIEFSDGCALSASVQMYGGMGIFIEGQLDNKYYTVAKQKPSPLSSAFSEEYYGGVISSPDAGKLSLKALLATEQRIPGLGNGVLQDILFNSKLHPRRKVNSLSEGDRATLFGSVKTTLGSMAEGGGRDTELDLFGRPGGYQTILSAKTAGKPCPVCGASIKKEAYMGGSVYFCERCQRQ